MDLDLELELEVEEWEEGYEGDEKTEEEGDCADKIVCVSGGMNLSQTASESEADLKLLETEDSLHASRGVVSETTLAMHPSGKFCRSM